MSRKSYVDSWVKFRVATEHVAVSLNVLSSDVSEAGDRTDASGSNFRVSTNILWRTWGRTQVQAAINVASLPFLIISQFRKN